MSNESTPDDRASDATEPDDVLNWDVCIDPRPPRPSGKVKVRLTYRGRAKPIPVDDPNNDATDEEDSRENAVG